MTGWIIPGSPEYSAAFPAWHRERDEEKEGEGVIGGRK
jgi:hypothetical protein